MRRAPGRLLGLLLVVGVASGAGFWAGQQFDGSDQDVVGVEPEPVTAMARDGTLSEQYPVPINVEWSQDLSVPFLGPSGVVTSLDADPAVFDSVASGFMIGAVDGQPIVIIEGEHPAYRIMTTDTSGPDVAQLQQFLVSKGFLSATADGDYGPSTADAVETWWATLGIEDRGTVPFGAVIFVANLPRLMTVDSSVKVGDLIATGTPLLVGVSQTPTVTATLTELQEQRFFAEGAEFSVVDKDGSEIPMIVGGAQARDLATDISLDFPPDQIGRPSIATLSPGRAARLSGLMTITAPIEGTIVPIAALADLTAPETTIRFADGDVATVTVVALVGGEAIVEPLEPGAVVVVGR